MDECGHNLTELLQHAKYVVEFLLEQPPSVAAALAHANKMKNGLVKVQLNMAAMMCLHSAELKEV